MSASSAKHKHHDRAPNRLINETSTYLLQHAYNPVDWYAWGTEALERAKHEDKPILLSVGYAACHWCHVMEHESFEDEETAKYMNEHFVNIKVDREERTDLDEIYMKAVQMMTGHGGWPMTVFLTPELKPFFGGTYFPPDDRHGLPSFKRLLKAINEAWSKQREEIEESSTELIKHLKSFDEISASMGAGSVDYSVIDEGIDKLIKHSDSTWGGFGGAPKFPHSFSLDLAMRCAAGGYKGANRREDCLKLVTTSLDKMAYGGIHDQLGGGFARYSVDRQWMVPHFEKMLYDNALLAQTYLNGYLLTGRKYWARVARGILDFVLRELRTEHGAFYSSLDADSEGEEGKFYVWTRDEIVGVLGRHDSEFFCDIFGVTKNGNFEHGTNVLHLSDSPEKLAEKHKLSVEQMWSKIEPMRERLMEDRETRVRPGRDEKVLTSWNSLMITALVEGYRVLQDPKYLQAAQDATQFILTELNRSDRLLRTWGQGKAKLNGYLDDYVFFAQALLDLASVDPNPLWIDKAIKYAREALELFWDDQGGGLYYTSKEHEALVTRPRSQYDGSIPSGTSVATMVLLRLSILTNDSEFRTRTDELLRIHSPLMVRVPDQFANMLSAMELSLSSAPEMVLISEPGAGESFAPLLFSLYEHYLPNKVVLAWRQGEPVGERKLISGLLEGRVAIGNKATAYICKNFTCDAPINEPAELRNKLKTLATS